MDHLKSFFSSVRQHNSSPSSAPAHVTRAANELIVSLCGQPVRPSSANDAASLTALSHLSVRASDHADAAVAEKISVARKFYVAEQGGNAGKRESAAKEFDETVKNSLVATLGPRNQVAYLKEQDKQTQKWKNGHITEAELHQNLAKTAQGLANETINASTSLSIESEMLGAMDFLRDEHDVAGALKYMWGGKAAPEMTENLARFEVLMDDVIEMIVQSDARNNSRSSASSSGKEEIRTEKKREFVKVARHFLGGLLQDQAATVEYQKKEQQTAEKYLSTGPVDYAAYKNEMLDFVANDLPKIAVAQAVTKAVSILIEESTLTPGAAFTVPTALEAVYTGFVDRPLRQRWQQFDAHVNKTLAIDQNTVKESNDQDRRHFLSAVRKKLIEILPEAPINLRRNFKEHLARLDIARKKGYITTDVYNSIALKPLHRFMGQHAGVEVPRPSAVHLWGHVNVSEADIASGESKTPGSLHEEAQAALKSVLNEKSTDKEVIESLAYLWGEPVDRQIQRRFAEFGASRNRYIQPGDGDISRIPTDCKFVVEARNILVGRLPERLQKRYADQQEALKSFGLGATFIAESSGSFVSSFLLKQ
jgi:hypothetical protein